MKTSKKIFLGGVGALTPIIMNLLVIDLNVLLLKLTLFALLGYAIRVIVLFYLGGIVAFLHKDENNPVKIFELGIVAPAMITALINAGQIDVPKVSAPAASSSIGAIHWVASAYAQEPPQVDSTRKAIIAAKIKTFSMPEESKIQQFWRGLIGLKSRKVWFVIVSKHESLAEAQKQVQQIHTRTKQFRPEIYAPFGDDRRYSVVIGANLTRAEARVLQKRAIKAGLPGDTFLWTFPKD